eukprot:CAMPEP_0176407508 /NCGR_PEP_ID=MMETSP0127-20121128/1448_1 /TAXON_ID=938130 /ORGANISM="Platyophrya macrostoma, Strain WH" /LENGTH=519 /DNA_ID=CAMNT_0017786717 /DNA_START=155 /DNA_END=1714 /DNA_ORIENTATION=-
MKKIYCLIRTKKGQKPQDRFVKEVLASPCFEPLRKEVGDAELKRRCSIIQAVAGDITEDHLGMSDEIYNEIANSVNFITHIAATVDFQEKLHLSIQMNTLGALRVLALAHKSKHLEAMVHTSTCYVNWARKGRDVPVKEELYPLSFDPEAMCKHILSLHESSIASETERLLTMYNFPNTYTFTKSMAEHLIRKNKGKLPVTIVRPAIIGCSYRDPCPGWIDALTAAGGLFLTVGLGIVNELQMNSKFIADLVPVDHVCNILLKATFKTALHYRAAVVPSPSQPERLPATPQALVVPNKLGVAALSTNAVNSVMSSPSPLLTMSTPNLAESVATDIAFPFVFHAGTSSSLNALTWGICKEGVESFWNSGTRHPRAIGKANVYMSPNPIAFRVVHTVRQLIPFYAMKAASMLPPPIGSEKKRKLIAKYEKALNRAADLRFQFSPFVQFEWVYDQSNMKFLDEGLPTKVQKDFTSDTYEINWWTYVQLYNYGMCKHIINSAEGRNPPVVPRSGAEAFARAKL